MNFCLFCANYLPNLGGVERYVYNLSKQLLKLGHSVTVVTSNVFDLPYYEVDENGIEIFRMPCYNFMKGRYPILNKNAKFKELDEKLSHKHFDLVVINARFYIHSLYAANFANKKRIKCITIEHGSTHLSVDNKILDFAVAHVEHFVTMLLKKKCKDYYAVSNAAGKWSEHFGIKSKGTLYNAVDIENIKQLEAKPVCDYKNELNIPDDATVIAFTGRLLKIKGVYELLDAYNALNRDDVYLIYAGDGPEMDELKKHSTNNIIFLGQVDFEHIISLLRQSDIYCLPSVSEGMSTSVLEAVATNTFVITTYNGGARELITSDEYGIITMGNSAQETKLAIEKALNKEYRSTACDNAYQKLLDGFTWQKTAEKLESLVK
ncbi:MAG: glycosyltransferase family 4 protein [Clostridia bacterium]|nr:glycosyltransferase family 4 protein [Clostridia bacterium]